MSSTLTDLTAATSLSGTDLFYATVGGNSRKFTGSNFFTFSSSTISAIKALNLTESTTTRTIEVVRPSSNSAYSFVAAESAGGTKLGYIRADGLVAGSAVETNDDATAAMDVSTVGGVSVKDTGVYAFSSTSAWWGTLDVQLRRDAANCLAIYGSAGQTVRIYNTRTDASNYVRLALQTGSGYVEIAGETAGSGTDNIDVRLTSAGTGGVKLNGSCGIYVGAGAPSFTATQGSIYLNSTGSSTSTRLYVNTTGSTTWTNVVTAA